ncbi:SDR family NAD(P)-dependent oxidoreductase [Chloroflexota bacterium]
MDMGLAGKTVVIIGGSSNLGRTCSLAFAEEGANVVIVARHIEDCQRVADKCSTLGKGRFIPFSADATILDDCKKVVKKTLDEFGRIDVLVNTIGWNRLGRFLDIDPKDWDKIIKTNYTYTLNMFHVVLPVMIKQKGGNIITMSSVIGRKGDIEEPIYGGLKAGQINFTHSIAQEMGQYGIRANCVAPALTMPEGTETLGGESVWKGTFSPEDQKSLIRDHTAITALGRLAKPRDVAMAVLFLASDVTADHITGIVIGTDGGQYYPH